MKQGLLFISALPFLLSLHYSAGFHFVELNQPKRQITSQFENRESQKHYQVSSRTSAANLRCNSFSKLAFSTNDAVEEDGYREYDILGMKLDSRTVTFYINALLIFTVLSFSGYNLASANFEYARGWTWEEYLFRMPGDNLLRYESSANENPILTKALTSMTAYGVGDFTTQVLQGKQIEEIDLKRSGRSAFAGFIGHGPLCHYWIEFMETYLSFGGAWWAFVPKVIADQTGWSLYLNAMYVTITKGLQFKSPAFIWNEIKTSCVPALVAGWRFWPLVHCISFSSLLPVTFKLLFIDVMEVVWVTILSRVTQDTNFEATDEDAETEVSMELENIKIMKDFLAETEVSIEPENIKIMKDFKEEVQETVAAVADVSKANQKGVSDDQLVSVIGSVEGEVRK